MKYEVGDSILVLLTEEEGKVIEIINESMVMIEVKGTKFPVYNDQIDFPYFKMFSEKRKADKKKLFVDQLKSEKASELNSFDDGVYMSFVPVFEKDIFDDPIVEKIKLYLVNKSSIAYNFSYQLCYSGVSDFELKNTLLPHAEFYLHDVSFENFSNNPRFDFEFSLFKQDKLKAPYYSTSLKFKPKQFFKRLEELKANSTAVFSDLLFETYPNKEEEIKVDLSILTNSNFRLYDASKAHQHLEPYKSVIDLHIEKLTTDWKHLSNFEILTIQLRTLEKYISLAVAHFQPSLTVIHGIGEGKLKQEIHAVLESRNDIKDFSNNYNPKYGYGATEINFKY
jgi:hypothetical protein